jgi:phosphoribosylformylglycinamidine cyclo-ligase
MSGVTYREAGVDIDAGDELVERIKPLAARTRIAEVLGGVGGFAGLCAIPPGMREPILVSGTDGVGTKLKLAFDYDVHDTVGIDLVAMCVNDVITTGARPLFFLDSFATSKLDVDRGEAVIRGIAEGCRQSGCALLGGETAELPGFYAPGEYDLAGFAVGVVERSKILDGSKVAIGDTVIAVASTGFHSNGFSLVRKVLFERAGHRLDQTLEGFDAPLGRVLLTPTRIYADLVRRAVATERVRAISHITGGGVPGNLPRVLPEGLGATVDATVLGRPPIFDLVQRAGNIDEAEMRRTFNLGIGLVLVVERGAEEEVLAAIAPSGDRAAVVGEIVPVATDERVLYR